VTKKNGVFWDVTPYGSCNYRRFGGTYRLHHQGDKKQLRAAVKVSAQICGTEMLTPGYLCAAVNILVQSYATEILTLASLKQCSIVLA
jgi:hypothetical protein